MTFREFLILIGFNCGQRAIVTWMSLISLVVFGVPKSLATASKRELNARFYCDCINSKGEEQLYNVRVQSSVEQNQGDWVYLYQFHNSGSTTARLILFFVRNNRVTFPLTLTPGNYGAKISHRVQGPLILTVPPSETRVFEIRDNHTPLAVNAMVVMLDLYDSAYGAAPLAVYFPKLPAMF